MVNEPGDAPGATVPPVLSPGPPNVPAPLRVPPCRFTAPVNVLVFTSVTPLVWVSPLGKRKGPASTSTVPAFVAGRPAPPSTPAAVRLTFPPARTCRAPPPPSTRLTLLADRSSVPVLPTFTVPLETVIPLWPAVSSAVLAPRLSVAPVTDIPEWIVVAPL